MIKLFSRGREGSETKCVVMGWPVPGGGLLRQVARAGLGRVTFQLSPDCCSKVWQARAAGKGAESKVTEHGGGRGGGRSLHGKGYERSSSREPGQSGIVVASVGIGSRG